MGKINIGRLILGGVVAGLIADILDYFVDGLWLSQRWASEMKLLNHDAAITMRQIVLLDLIGIAGGLAAIWIYAAIRPRFGAGVRTAVYAGVAVWFLTCLLPNAGFMYALDFFSHHLTLYTTLGGLVEIVVGTIVGAALYKEAGAGSAADSVGADSPRHAVRA